MRGNSGQGWIADTMPYYAVFALVVGVLFFLFVFITSSYTTGQYGIPAGLEDNIVRQRFWTDSCFGVYGLSNRLSTVLDWAHFEQKVMDSCYKLPENAPFIAYRLTLTADDEKKVVSTVGWDKISGSTQITSGEREIRVLKNGAIQQGELQIEVKGSAQ